MGRALEDLVLEGQIDAEADAVRQMTAIPRALHDVETDTEWLRSRAKKERIVDADGCCSWCHKWENRCTCKADGGPEALHAAQQQHSKYADARSIISVEIARAVSPKRQNSCMCTNHQNVEPESAPETADAPFSCVCGAVTTLSVQ